MKAQEASSTQPTMATKDSDRIARYDNLVIYERSGVLVAEFGCEVCFTARSVSY